MFLNKLTKGALTVLSVLIFVSANAQNTITAHPQITVDKQLGCAPEAVKFSLINTNASSVTWVIGKDTIKNASTQQSYLFPEAGIYGAFAIYKTVKGKDTIINQPAIIKLGRGTNPVNLSATRTYLCNGADTVTFTAYSDGAMSYDWIIDGTNYINAGNKITHRFNTSGTKTISVRIKDTFGCYGLQTFTDFITISNAPQIDFDANVNNGCLPLSVNINNKTVAGNSEITEWKWTLSGSNSETSYKKNPSLLTYNKSGNYDITLTVKTKDGCIYSNTKKSFITVNDTLTPTFTSDKKIICPGDVIIYTNTSGPLAKSKLVWNFPGGKVLPYSTENKQFVQYTTYGNYNAGLSFKNGDCINTTTLSEAAVVERLKADFTVSNFCNCRVPDTIKFINQSILPESGTATYEWIFYDADGKTILSVSNEKDPSFIYTKFGKYSVKLIVKHSNGCVDSIYKEKLLTFEEIQVEDITVTCDVGCVGKDLGIKLTQLPGCRKNITMSYEWIVYKKGSTEELTRLYGEAPNVKIYDTGSYDVKLILKNSEGCKVEKMLGGLLKIVIPVPDFKVDTAYACLENGIILTQNTTPAYLTYNHNWEITLSTDSTVKLKGSGEIFKPAFVKPGIYHVKYSAGFGEWCHFPIERKNIIKISGITADFSAEKTDGCLPFATNLKAVIKENKHYKNKSEAVAYAWSASPANGVNFSSPNKAQTNISFTGTGYFSITLKVTNSDGCTYTVTKNDFFVAGVESNFKVQANGCLTEKIPLVNKSTRNATIFEWSSNRNGVKFLPNSNVKDPVMQFSESGNFIIKLVSISAEGCSDTSFKYISIENVKADFASNDTMNSCAPAYVSFSAYGTGADSFIWHFGDGEILRTKDTNIAHIYKANSGDANSGYDVMLIAKSRFGCADTIVKKKYIKVVGPIPAFSITNNIGCEPLHVNFTDESKNTNKFYLDFGDFSKLDTVKFGPHTYKITGENAEFQVFKPRLLAKDEFGCSVWAYANDSIVVYRKPISSFTINNTNICQGEPVEFTNNSKFVKKFYWDFDGDGKTDDTSSNPKAFLAAGIYGAKLTVENTFGCTDTFYLPNAFTVYVKPSAEITATHDTICAGGTVQFTINPKNNIKIKSYKWFINNELTEGNSTVLTKAFLQHGIYAVSAEIESVNGCKTHIKLNRKILVPDTAAPQKPVIEYITVSNDTFINIYWAKSSDVYFKKYNVYRISGNHKTLIFSTNKIDETTFTDRSTSTKKHSYSYLIEVENICGKTSLSITHTSVLLHVKPEENNKLKLSWNVYKGWGNVKQYLIYRAENDGFKLIATVSGTDTQYVDSDLCDATYKYYIVAIDETSFKSYSNTAFARPVYVYNTLGENVDVATVTDDEKVLVKWQKKQHENAALYFIDRFEPGKGWQKNFATTNTTQFIDENTEVNAKNYFYRISVADRCGKITSTGTIGSSILLKAKVENDNVLLSWSRYNFWENGVSQYRIEMQDENGNWQFVNVVSANDTTYLDTEPHLNIKGPYVYRIIAVEMGISANESVSNKAKAILHSRLYVPNIFSPNNDNNNEEFKPVCSFIHENTGSENHNYKMSIYNRWGEKIFESNNIEKGWDGKFKGIEAPEETYMYIINAFGYDKQRYYLKGSFHLVR